MDLKTARDELLKWLANDHEFDDADKCQAKILGYLIAYKNWERKDTLKKAIKQKRLTARVCGSSMSKITKFDIGSIQVKLANGASFKEFMNPRNFLDKKKNDLGLHDLSAILVRKDVALSKQLFPKPDNVVAFMPIAQQEDIAAMQTLGACAKAHKDKTIYPSYKFVRSHMTRLNYVSPDDMAIGFQAYRDADGTEHVRYGNVSRVGQPQQVPLPDELLEKRRLVASMYQRALGLMQTSTANNEVTVKYRQHDGGFPYIGKQCADLQKEYNLGKNDFVLQDMSYAAPVGHLTDDLKFTKLAVA